METVFQDFRFAVRTLLKNRGFTVVAVVVLALGIGANSAIFSVVNSILLRPLPFKNPDRLVSIWETNKVPKFGLDKYPASAGDFVDWRDQNRVFDQVSGYYGQNFNLTGHNQPEKIAGLSVSGDFFEMIGVEPMLGRSFTPEEDKPGANRVVVISHNLWQDTFGSDPDLIGKQITLNDRNYSVIGIMPAGFNFPRGADVPSFFGAAPKTDIWSPMALGSDAKNERANYGMTVLARMKPGISIQQAQTGMDIVARRIEEQHKDFNEGSGVILVPLQEQMVGSFRKALLVLVGAVTFVLLIACSNVANLLLVRSAARQREIAIRTAIGASRWRIIRQLLTESISLSLFSGLLGIVLCEWSVRILPSIVPGKIPRLHEINIDARVLAFTLGVAFLTGVLSGLVPALQSSNVNLNESLKNGSKGLMGGIRQNRIRCSLVIAEVALSFILLIGAGLMIRSFASILRINPGFNPTNAVAMGISLPSSKYRGEQAQTVFFQQTLDQVRVVNGVQFAGIVSDLPLGGGDNAGGFTIEGRIPPPGSDGPVVSRRVASDGYFEAVGIPLIKGRFFNAGDNRNAPGVLIVGEAWAKKYMPEEDPLGKRVKMGGPDSDRPWLEIVGVVGDVRQRALEDENKPTVYWPFQQRGGGSMTLVVRSTIPTANIIKGLQQAIWSVDKDLPVTDIKTMQQYIDDSVGQRRFNVLLLGLFALLALILAAVGIYGVMSYSVTQRTKEIGIRIALGAEVNSILSMIIRQGLLLIGAGLVIGVTGAIALTRFMTSLLYGVTANDPMTYVAISIILAGVALAANYVPARRAARVDPMVALRHE